MSQSDAPNPYAVTTLEIGSPINDPVGRMTVVARWMVYLGLPLMIVGSVLAFIDIENIVFCGAVMFVWGVIVVFLSRRNQRFRFRWFGWACCGFPVAVFLIIFLMSWSPEDAQHPISILIALFTAAVHGGAFATLYHARSATSVEQPQLLGLEVENFAPVEPPVR